MTPHDTSTTTSHRADERQPNVPGGVTARLKARRRRIGLIRKRTVAIAASTFALIWGVIFVQLVSGHDPALAHNSSSTAASPSGSPGSTSSGSTGSTSSGSTSSGSTSSGSSSSGSSGSGSSGSGSTSPITTSQS